MPATMFEVQGKSEQRPTLNAEETALIMALAANADDHQRALAQALCQKISGRPASEAGAAPCPNCGKPLLTATAKVCACCWQRVG